MFLIQGLLEKQLSQTYITFQAVFDWVHSFFQIHCGSRLVITHSQRLVPKFALAAEKTTERIVIAEVSSMEMPLNWMVSGIGNHEVGQVVGACICALVQDFFRCVWSPALFGALHEHTHREYSLVV